MPYPVSRGPNAPGWPSVVRPGSINWNNMRPKAIQQSSVMPLQSALVPQQQTGGVPAAPIMPVGVTNSTAPMLSEQALSTEERIADLQRRLNAELDQIGATTYYPKSVTDAMVEADKADSEAQRAADMAKWLSGHPMPSPSDISYSFQRPVYQAPERYVAPEVTVSPLAAALAAIAGIADPNAAAPVSAGLYQSAIQRQQMADQQARMLWNDTVEANRQRYQADMAGYAEAVKNADAMRELQDQRALDAWKSQREQQVLAAQGKYPALTQGTKTALQQQAAEAAAGRTAMDSARGLSSQLNMEYRNQANLNELLGVNEREANRQLWASNTQAAAIASRENMNRYNQDEEWRRLMATNENRRMIAEMQANSAARVAGIHAEAARMSKSGSPEKLSDAEKARVQQLKTAYEKSVTSWNALAPQSKDMFWNTGYKDKVAAAGKKMAEAEAQYSDYVNTLSGRKVPVPVPAPAPAPTGKGKAMPTTAAPPAKKPTGKGGGSGRPVASGALDRIKDPQMRAIAGAILNGG